MAGAAEQLLWHADMCVFRFQNSKIRFYNPKFHFIIQFYRWFHRILLVWKTNSVFFRFIIWIVFICPSDVLCYGTVHLSVCLSICLSEDTHFHAITQTILQLSNRYLVYSFPIGPWGSLFVVESGPGYSRPQSHKGQIRFLKHNPKYFRAINWKLDMDICLGSGKMLLLQRKVNWLGRV